MLDRLNFRSIFIIISLDYKKKLFFISESVSKMRFYVL